VSVDDFESDPLLILEFIDSSAIERAPRFKLAKFLRDLASSIYSEEELI
jgi:hypothetical protein